MSRRYAIVVEAGAENFSAYFPDLPGCVTTGASLEEVRENMREAIQLHLYSLWRDGEDVPAPSCIADGVEVPDDPQAWGEGVVEAE